MYLPVFNMPAYVHVLMTSYYAQSYASIVCQCLSLATHQQEWVDLLPCLHYVQIWQSQCILDTDLTITVYSDRQGIDQRLFFSSNGSMITQTVTASLGVQTCSPFRTYVKVACSGYVQQSLLQRLIAYPLTEFSLSYQDQSTWSFF